MTHEATITRQGPALWVAECSCGQRFEAQHPNSVERRHQDHQRVQEAKAVLEEAVARASEGDSE